MTQTTFSLEFVKRNIGQLKKWGEQHEISYHYLRLHMSYSFTPFCPLMGHLFPITFLALAPCHLSLQLISSISSHTVIGQTYSYTHLGSSSYKLYDSTDISTPPASFILSQFILADIQQERTMCSLCAWSQRHHRCQA